MFLLCVSMCFLPFFHLLKTSEVRLKHFFAELLQRRGRPTFRSEEVLGASEINNSKQISNELINSFCVSSIENLLNRLESLCCIFVSWIFHVWFHHIDFVLGEVTDVSQLHLASLVASLLHVFSFVFLFIFCVRCSQPRTTVDRRLGRRMRRSKIWHRKP